MSLGTLLRRQRRERKLTLKTVAEKVGISEGFLSQAENDVKSPSVETLLNICDALGINAGDLLNQVKNQEQIFIVRKSEWPDVDMPHTGFVTRRFVPPEERASMDSAILFIEPGKSLPVRKDVKQGQEILCILQGSLQLVRGDLEVVLKEGDTAHYFADPTRLSITNKGRKRAVVLWVGTI